MQVDISKIDSNFLAGSKITRQDIVWYPIWEAPIRIYGLAHTEPEKFWRLPESLMGEISEGLGYLGRFTTGGRIRFRTDSPFIAFRARSLYSIPMNHMPLTGSAGTDLLINGRSFTTFRPQPDYDQWYEGIFEFREPLPGMEGLNDVEMNMCLYNGIRDAWIGIQTGSQLEAPKPYTIEKPMVFYGNSVTQGGCASKPGNSFPGFLGRWLDANHINLGFSGAGRGEQALARHIASLNMSLCFLDYDHNAPDAEHLRKTHYPFYKTIRDAHPDLPIIMATMPNEDSLPRWRTERREAIWESYQRARAEGDQKVWFVDGITLFEEEDRDACTMDGAHPNDLGFYRMAKNLLPVIREALDLTP